MKIVQQGDGKEEVVKPKVEGAGELRVKGDILFTEYIGKPEATAEAFDSEVSHFLASERAGTCYYDLN